MMTSLKHVSGPYKVGLVRSCVKIAGRHDMECYRSPHNVEWMLTLICIFIGEVFNFGAMMLFVCAYWRPPLNNKAKWFGVASVIFLCIATIVFPAGFNRLDVGGAPYQLPRNCHIGMGYIFFMLALWTVVVAELLNAKIFSQR